MRRLHTSGSNIKDVYSHNVRKVLVLYTGGTIGMLAESGVYEPKQNYLISELKKHPIFHDNSYVTSPTYDEVGIPLALPITKEGLRILYCIYEYEPLLDSADMSFGDYARIAKDIKKSYYDFDGFVILHGTDTMAYTASALSFMMQHLGKPIVITGSQIPIFEVRSDGRDNFLGALMMAGYYSIPEVMIFFYDKLFRGNRATKFDTASLDAFQSPNLAPLAEMKIDIKVNWDAVHRPTGFEKFDVHLNMCPHVSILHLFPSISIETIESYFSGKARGVVLQTYGSGNGPSSRLDILDVFKSASDNGILILNITQCIRGGVKLLYKTGKAILDAGVIPGNDMTLESAIMKMSYVLSKDEWNLEEKKKKLTENLRGEMQVTIPRTDSMLQLSIVQKMADLMSIKCSEEVELLKKNVFPNLLCDAACEGDVECLKKLISSGANPLLHDYDGRTVLHVAVSEGQTHVVKYLLEYEGVSVHAKDRYGNSPLMDAIRFKQLEIVDILVKTGAHLILPEKKIGEMICSAAMEDDTMALNVLQRANIDLNLKDCCGKTALHVASSIGNIDAVEFLLKHGANANEKDLFHYKPLHYVFDSKVSEILKKHTIADL